MERLREKDEAPYSTSVHINLRLRKLQEGDRVSTRFYREHPTRFDCCGMMRKLGVPSAINGGKCERRTSRESASEGLIKLVVGRHGLGTAVRHHPPVQANYSRVRIPPYALLRATLLTTSPASKLSLETTILVTTIILQPPKLLFKTNFLSHIYIYSPADKRKLKWTTVEDGSRHNRTTGVRQACVRDPMTINHVNSEHMSTSSGHNVDRKHRSPMHKGSPSFRSARQSLR